MQTERSPTRPALVALMGGVLVALGTVPPWIVVAPGQEMVIQVYVAGMEWGVMGVDYVVLGVLAVGVAAAEASRRARHGGYLAATTGVAVALVTLYYLAVTLLGGPTSLGTFLPGPGAGITLLGATLLVVGGWRHLEAVGRAPGTDGDAAAAG